MKSQILTPDGRAFDPETLETLGQEKKIVRMYELKVSKIKLKTSDKPKDALDRALMQVRESYGHMAMNQMVLDGVPKDEAYLKAQAVVGDIANPFQSEPAARAVFLAMAEELHHLRGVVDQLSSRLEALDSKQLEDVEGLPEAK